ncbi:MAG: signal peptidase II [Clostridia bacterium]|nr:signal peptidase II [Clostridia bacterium]MBR6620034.1 signal peptidase II [Clostridia bacterium]
MVQVICCCAIAAIAAADQLIKLAVLASSLVSGGIYTVIPDILQLRYVENTGAAFSLFSGKTELLSVFTAAVLLAGFVLIFTNKIKSKLVLTSVVMLMGGGLGNLIDRVFRHFVVDYIEVLFVDFAVFNFADCFVTVGEFILIGYLLYDIIKDFKKGRQKADGQ